MTTIEIIAKKAGVSRGTVDRVLHDRGQVKPETAERVRAVMEEMDFQPNALGRAFYLSRRKNKIGILVAFREPDFQQQIASGIEDGIVYARQHGIEIVTEIAPPDDDRGYLAALERLLSSDIQGLALRGNGSEAAYDILRSLPENHIPIVAYNQDVPKKLRNCFVGQDSYRSGACAAYLMRQIAPAGGRILIVGVDWLHYSSEDRIRGFADRLRDCMEVSDVMYGKGSHELAYRLTRDKLRELPDLTGVFVSGAGLSGAAQAVEDTDLTGKVKVVGYDLTESNTRFLEKGTVQFLIDQGPYAQGYRSVQLLTDAVFQDKPVETELYDTGILIRCPYNC